MVVSVRVCVQVPYHDGTQQWMCRTKTDQRVVRVFIVVDFALCLLLPLVAITFCYTAIAISLGPHCCNRPAKSQPLHTCTPGKVSSVPSFTAANRPACQVQCPSSTAANRPAKSQPLHTCTPGKVSFLPALL